MFLKKNKKKLNKKTTNTEKFDGICSTPHPYYVCIMVVRITGRLDQLHIRNTNRSIVSLPC